MKPHASVIHGRRVLFGSGLFLPLLLIALLLPAPVEARTTFSIVFKNLTQSDVKLVGTTNNCWIMKNLELGNSIEVNPGQTGKIDTEDKDSGSCFNDSSWQDLELIFKGPGGVYPNPYAGAISQADAFPYEFGSNGGWDLLAKNATLYMRNWPRGPLPINPSQFGDQSGSQSKGMFCLTPSQNQLHVIALTLRPGTDCYGPASRRLRPAKGMRPAKAGPGSGSNSAKIIYDLFQIGKAACYLTKPSQAWGFSGCEDIGDTNKWDLHNVTADVRDAKPSTDTTVVPSWEQVDEQTYYNRTEVKGSQDWKYTYRKGDESSTETESGWKVGGRLEFEKKLKLPFIGDLKTTFEVSFDHEWGTKEEQKHSVEKEVEQSSSIEAEEHHKTTMVIKQRQAQVLTTFTADLTAGTKGKAEPLKTPAPRPLGFSAARNQPCIGMIAGKSGNSLIGLAEYAKGQGFTPETVGLPEEQRAFLKAAKDLTVSDAAADRCPGYPADYPAQFAFDGTAAYRAKAGGPTTEGGIAPKMPGIVTCTYSSPITGSPAEPPATPADPCQSGTTGPPLSEAGTIIEGADAGPGAVRAGRGGSLINADEGKSGAPVNGKLQVYQGLDGEDILHGGKHGESLLGGGAQDILDGAGGNDALDGEAGDDTLHGNAGDDTLSDVKGTNGIFGDRGDDRLSSRAGAGGGLLGGPGSDTLIMRGKDRIALMGGNGNDTYRLRNGARPRSVVEMPREGFDTVLTDRSIRLTPFVEKVRATGQKGVRLAAGDGEQRLIGSKGNDRLAGGADSDLLKGSRGNDRILLQPWGIDLAEGGPGADRFQVIGSRLGVDARVGKGLPVRSKSAHVIADFKPAQGDKLVLSTKSFGRKLGTLKRNMRITRGNLANGKRPQLLVSPRRGLVSFDADGTGRRLARVVVILKGHSTVPAGAIRIVKG